jgi:hypothetical protein
MPPLVSPFGSDWTENCAGLPPVISGTLSQRGTPYLLASFPSRMSHKEDLPHAEAREVPSPHYWSREMSSFPAIRVMPRPQKCAPSAPC